MEKAAAGTGFGHIVAAKLGGGDGLSQTGDRLACVPIPPTTPDGRNPTDVAPTESYRPGQPVWVYRGSWRPAVVLTASVRAVTVRYRPSTGRGTGVDTVLGSHLATRDEPDPELDHDDPNTATAPTPTGGF